MSSTSSATLAMFAIRIFERSLFLSFQNTEIDKTVHSDMNLLKELHYCNHFLQMIGLSSNPTRIIKVARNGRSCVHPIIPISVDH